MVKLERNVIRTLTSVWNIAVQGTKCVIMRSLKIILAVQSDELLDAVPYVQMTIVPSASTMNFITQPVSVVCSPNPCLNDGICQTMSNGTMKCYCSNDSVTGIFCEKEYLEDCKRASPCKNKAACYTVNQTETCICRLGFHGPICSEDANENLTSTVDTGARFTDVALPKTVICYISSPCPIPFTVTRNIHDKPSIVPGYLDPSMKILMLELLHIESRGGIVHGILEVIDNTLGTKTICLDSVEISRQVTILIFQQYDHNPVF
ncbi:protein delta homolog 1-like [Saccostrea echinata]|uniref:protein delta homolog 1-like n=1 Tax=Saccostrea echinata TaxID=191078 RepID=UPI002A825ED0|nr:protein delta homolog 1-like [Saccostrea echinata]